MKSAPALIAYAIPAFLLLIGLELLWSKAKKWNLYRLNDSINNLSLGIFSRISAIFVNGLLLAGYFGLYHTVFATYKLLSISWDGIAPALIDWQWKGPWATAFVCFFGYLLVDHQYYWFHRMSHQVAFIWGSHEPHHQSEEYNLSVALRQGSFQGIFSFPFYLPLAFLGLNPWLFAVFSQMNTIYQFWIHTETVKKIGFFEWFLNTPSHHRVHHGINPQYIDKNHAGTFIIWDKIYGTFAPEKETVVYGTVEPLGSWNPVWANFQYWWKLLKESARMPGVKNKVLVFFARPGWKPRELGGKPPIPEVSRQTRLKFDPPVPGSLKKYAFALFFLGLLFAVLLIGLNVSGKAHGLGGLLAGAAALWTLFNAGLLLESRKYAAFLESLRLAGFTGFFASLLVRDLAYLSVPIALLLAVHLLLGAWFVFLQKRTLTFAM